MKHLESNSRGLKLSDSNNRIDHTRPFHSFKKLHLPSVQLMANLFLNLQVLQKAENLAKGAKFDYAEWSIAENWIKLLQLDRGWKSMDEQDAVDDDDESSHLETEDVAVADEDDDRAADSSKDDEEYDSSNKNTDSFL